MHISLYLLIGFIVHCVCYKFDIDLSGSYRARDIHEQIFMVCMWPIMILCGVAIALVIGFTKFWKCLNKHLE